MRRFSLILCLTSWIMTGFASALTFQLDYSYDVANGNF
ncbi:MAG: hypothetical protein JWL90_3301, partial [Chthoniobacteraceae bacterium]|nr:hypothetical protein [Chthoniobacteraceae bacterium]